MPDLTVSAGLARGLIDLAVLRGASADALLESSRLTSRDLEDPDNRVPLVSYVALVRAGKLLCHDPALALHYGANNDLSMISVVGLIGNASRTMLDALAQLTDMGGWW